MVRRIVYLLATMLLVSGLGCVIHGYRADAAILFHAGLLLVAAGLAPLSLAASRRPWRSAVLVANTIICLCIALVVLEGVWRLLGDEEAEPDFGAGYVYGDPESRSAEQVRSRSRAMTQLFTRRELPMLMEDPRGLNPFVLRPGTLPMPGGAVVHVNALGFRGPEIEPDKGPHYRIFVLGESTTFGVTVGPDEQPWPERLESLIRSELSCDAPVQVVNGGVPGWNLRHQLKRLEEEILPLQPDLILTYHGYNGFHLILDALPPALVEKAPLPPPRPSKLLERVERALRLRWFGRRYAAARRLGEAALESDPLESDFARLYQRLVDAVSDSGIQLAFSTFNMAVDHESPEEVIRFYEAAFPDVRARILANRLHSRIVREVGRGPGVFAIDTSAGLDGAYQDGYRDLIHFNQGGRDRLAGNILNGLRGHLQADTRLNCRLREPM